MIKSILIPILFSIGYSQCDANGDGELDILDVIEEINCILDYCWEGEPVCEGVEDIDGNCYETVQIGEQLWMAENLKTTRYNNGDEIPTGFTNSDWQDLHDTETGAFAVYPTDGDDASQEICGDNCADVFGNHYNYYAIYDGSGRNICPDGWHVPSNDEWTNLITYFDIDADPDVIWGNQSEIAGGMLKDTGTIEDGDGLWYSPNEGATNESGFTRSTRWLPHPQWWSLHQYSWLQ